MSQLAMFAWGSIHIYLCGQADLQGCGGGAVLLIVTMTFLSYAACSACACQPTRHVSDQAAAWHSSVV